MRVGLTILLLSLLIGPGTSWGLTPADKCQADKNKIAGKYAFCRQKAEMKAIKKGIAPDFSRCDAKVLAKWAKAEQRALDKGDACIDSVTNTAIQLFVALHADRVAAAIAGDSLFAPAFHATGQPTAYGAGSDGDVQAGAAFSYTDNGDGTITDNNTGLMWEKKDDSGGIHDKDNTYTWCDASCGAGNLMDGTITTVFLDTLNDVAGGGANCFAGYCDWRAPNARELFSLAHYWSPAPSIHPIFKQPLSCPACTDVTDPTCSCTAPVYHWTSSTTLFFSVGAWGVSFNAPNSQGLGKGQAHAVRAVRGGL